MFKMLVSLEFLSYLSFIIFFLPTFGTFLLNFYDTFASGNPFRNIRHTLFDRIGNKRRKEKRKEKFPHYDSS